MIKTEKYAFVLFWVCFVYNFRLPEVWREILCCLKQHTIPAIFSRFYKITISVNFLCGYQKMWRWLVFSRSILTDTARKYNAHIQLSSHPAVALSSHSWNVCFFQAQGFYFSSFLTEWVILHVLPRRALQECHWSTWTACLVILMKTREEKSLWLSWLKGLQMFAARFM